MVRWWLSVMCIPARYPHQGSRNALLGNTLATDGVVRGGSVAKPIWKKRNPKARHHTMTATEKAAAKRSARKEGRARPSLVDNINAIRGRRRKATND